ncbi:MAG TPA: hypothetical protein VFY56_03430 [Propionibacteriaceae bacterium]|nr:hypothetical protein [Propionibacteriaceae bacterium]
MIFEPSSEICGDSLSGVVAIATTDADAMKEWASAPRDTGVIIGRLTSISTKEAL